MNFNNASLVKVDLRDVDLANAEFSNADLSGAVLSGVSLLGIDLSTSYYVGDKVTAVVTQAVAIGVVEPPN